MTEHAYFNGVPAQEKVIELTGAEVGDEISVLVSHLGKSAALDGGSVEVKTIAEDAAKELMELIGQHPEGGQLAAKIDEKMDKQSAKSWFRESLDEEEGPTMQLQAGTESLEVLYKKGIIAKEMYDASKVNFAGVIWSSLANSRSSGPKQRNEDLKTRAWVTGDNEAVAISIIKLKAENYIQAQKEQNK